MDPARSKLGCKPRQLIRRFAAPKEETRAPRLQRLAEAGERMMKPPSLRTADRPLPRRNIVENVDRNYRPFRSCHRQSRLIMEAKILAKPDYGGVGHPSPSRPRAAPSRRPLDSLHSKTRA
jgi:hypothetical protein